jgi:hypothetical protein
VLDGEPPQIHLAQFLQRDITWASPEQPHRLFVAGSSIWSQEFDPQHGHHQPGQFLEVQAFPGLDVHRLSAQEKGFFAASLIGKGQSLANTCLGYLSYL